jgi:hypothetical protein
VAKESVAEYIYRAPPVPDYVLKYIDELPVRFKPGDCVRPIPSKYFKYVFLQDVVIHSISKVLSGVFFFPATVHGKSAMGHGIPQEDFELVDEPTENQKQISEKVLLEINSVDEALQKIKEGNIREVFPFSKYAGEGDQDV